MVPRITKAAGEISPDDGLIPSRPLPFKGASPDMMSVVASCNGLACVAMEKSRKNMVWEAEYTDLILWNAFTERHLDPTGSCIELWRMNKTGPGKNMVWEAEYTDLILWNAFTGEYKTLPKTNAHKKCYEMNGLPFGLYHASFEDDYKLLRVRDFGFSIYSLKNNAWRNVVISTNETLWRPSCVWEAYNDDDDDDDDDVIKRVIEQRTDSLSHSVGPALSPEKIVGDSIPFEPSPVYIPWRIFSATCPGEAFPGDIWAPSPGHVAENIRRGIYTGEGSKGIESPTIFSGDNTGPTLFLVNENENKLSRSLPAEDLALCPVLSILKGLGNMLRIKPIVNLHIPVCLLDVRGRSRSDACHITRPVEEKNQMETDTQEKDKNKAKNDKTEHKIEKMEKEKAIRSRKVKTQSPRSTKVNPEKVKVNHGKVKVNPDKAKAEK
nr:hypothetical protein [Tanacetum cinerariifolium]